MAWLKRSTGLPGAVIIMTIAPAIIASNTAKRGRPAACANFRRRSVRADVDTRDAVGTAIVLSSYVRRRLRRRCSQLENCSFYDSISHRKKQAPHPHAPPLKGRFFTMVRGLA